MGVRRRVYRQPGWEDQAPTGRLVCPECGGLYVVTVLLAYRVMSWAEDWPQKVTTRHLGVLYRCGTCSWAGNRPRPLVDAAAMEVATVPS